MVAEVGYSLNGLLEALENADVPGLEEIEPLPIIIPPSPPPELTVICPEEAGSMDKQEIPFLSATQLSDLIRSREVSPVEATEAYLDRISEIDGKLNSYITVCREEALAAAQEAEREIASGGYRGPLHGVPMAVKDQLNTRGIRTTGGSTILADNVPDEDATVIAKLKDAGSILLGKLNMSEFASGDAFRHPLRPAPQSLGLDPQPRHLQQRLRAATAAGLCATSLGEDTGGSIRGPATFCGLVGIRPTWGRVSRYGMQGAAWSMDTAGPISRTVTDCAMTLEAIAGHDPKTLTLGIRRCRIIRRR